jgi:hypothetical protein
MSNLITGPCMKKITSVRFWNEGEEERRVSGGENE